MAETDETETTDETEVEGTTERAAEETNGTPGEDAGIEEWKTYARKWERAKRVEPNVQRRRAKAAENRAAEAEAKLKERETADQSEQEKAIAKARDEAKAEAQSEGEQERRKDRLDVAVTRLAAKTFADTEDALLHVERAITAGDIAADDIFNDEGKVQTDALTTALNDLLERKPHLKTTAGKAAGDADAGKGEGAKDPENLGVEGHLKTIQRRP